MGMIWDNYRQVASSNYSISGVWALGLIVSMFAVVWSSYHLEWFLSGCLFAVFGLRKRD